MADAKIRLSVDGTSKVVGELSSVAAKMGDVEKSVVGSGEVIKTAFRGLVSAFAAFTVVDKIKDIALLNARFETLGAAMAVVGRNAGYSTEQMEANAQALQKTGISMIESRQQTMRLVQAHIDLSASTKLARIAQDAAVIGNMNSSDAFAHMIHGIQTGQTDVLRTIGLNVSMEQSYKQMAATLHKNADQLSENEKTQAVLNSVMLAGKGIAGTYEAAMDTAGKQVLSMTRYAEDLKVKQGEVFNEVLTIAVMGYTEHLKDANGQMNEMARNGELKKFGEDIAYTFSWVADIIDGAKNSALLLGGAIGAVAAKFSNWREYASDMDAAEKQFTGARLEEEKVRILAAYDARRTSINESYDKTNDDILNGQGKFVRAYTERLKAKAEAEAKINADRITKEDVYWKKVLEIEDKYANDSIAKRKAMQAAWQTTWGDNHKYDDRPAAAKQKPLSDSSGAYSALIKSIHEKIAANNLELSGYDKLSAAQKENIKLNELIATSVGKLTKAKIAEAKAGIELVRVTGRELVMRDALDKSMAAHKPSDAKDILDNIKKQDSAYINLRTSLDDYGQSVTDSNDLAQLELSLLGQSQVVRATVLEQYRIELDLKKRLKEIDNSSVVNKEGLRDEARSIAQLAKSQAGLKAQQGEWTKFYGDIYSGLSDSLYRAFESGKGFFQTFWDGIKNLFKTTVLKLAVQGVVGSVLGATLGTANAQGGEGGGLGSAVSLASQGASLWNGFSAAGSAAGVFGSTGFFSSLAGGLNGAGVGSGLTSSLGLSIGNGVSSVLGTSASGALSSGINAMLPYLPYVAIAAVAVAAIAKFSGGKDRVTGAQNVSGSLGTNNISRNVDWTKDGGWFNADTSGTWRYNLANSTAVANNGQSYQDTANVGKDSALLKSLNDAYAGMKEATTGYVTALGFSAESIASRADAINFALSGDETKDAKALQGALVGVADTMASDLVPGLKLFSKDGEAISTTLQRMAGGLIGANNVFESLGLAKFAATLDGAAAAEKLIELSGGVEKFANAAAFYMDNFRTDAEKLATTSAAVSKQMSALGYGSITTVEGFKNLVTGLDLTNSSQSSLYVELMKLAPAFKYVADAAGTSADTVDQALQAFNTAKNNVKSALNAVAGALDALSQKAIATSRAEFAAKDKISQAYFAAQDAVEAAHKKIADLTRQSADSLLSFSTNIKTFLNGLKGVAGGDSYAALKANLQSTAALAQGGDAGSQSALTGIAQRFLDAARNNSSSAAGYLQDEASVRELLSGVANSVDGKVKAMNLPAIVDPMSEANKELIDAQKRLLELTSLSLAVGASTDRSLVLIAGSSAALLEEFKVAHDDNIKAQSDLQVAQAAAAGLNIPQLATVSTFFTLLAELGTAKAAVATAGANLSDEVVKAAKAVKDKAIDFGKTTDAATTDADKFTDAMRLTNLSAKALRDVMDVTGLSPAAIVAILGSSSTGLGGIAVAGGASVTAFASAANLAGLSIGGFKELLDKNGLTATSFDSLKSITGQTTTTLAKNLTLAATSTDKLDGAFDSIKGAFSAFNTILAAVAPPDFTSAINLVFGAYGARLNSTKTPEYESLIAPIFDEYGTRLNATNTPEYDALINPIFAAYGTRLGESSLPDFSTISGSVGGFTSALGDAASAATVMAQLLASYKLPTGTVADAGSAGAAKSANQLLVEDWYRTNVNAIKTTDVQGIAYWIAEIERVGVLATKIAFSNSVAQTTGTAPIPIANFSAPPPQAQQTNNALLAEVKAMKEEIRAMRSEQMAGDLANVDASNKTTKMLDAFASGELAVTTTTET